MMMEMSVLISMILCLAHTVNCISVNCKSDQKGESAQTWVILGKI